MKRNLTYTTIAVLLGVALMFLPLSLFTTESKKGAEPYLSGSSPEQWTNPFKESSFSSERSAGITPQYPLDAISVGVMLSFSLIFAFIVSSQLKKRTA